MYDAKRETAYSSRAMLIRSREDALQRRCQTCLQYKDSILKARVRKRENVNQNCPQDDCRLRFTRKTLRSDKDYYVASLSASNVIRLLYILKSECSFHFRVACDRRYSFCYRSASCKRALDFRVATCNIDAVDAGDVGLRGRGETASSSDEWPVGN